MILIEDYHNGITTSIKQAEELKQYGLSTLSADMYYSFYIWVNDTHRIPCDYKNYIRAAQRCERNTSWSLTAALSGYKPDRIDCPAWTLRALLRQLPGFFTLEYSMEDAFLYRFTFTYEGVEYITKDNDIFRVVINAFQKIHQLNKHDKR